MPADMTSVQQYLETTGVKEHRRTTLGALLGSRLRTDPNDRISRPRNCWNHHLLYMSQFRSFSQSWLLNLALGGHILSYLTPKWASEYFREAKNVYRTAGNWSGWKFGVDWPIIKIIYYRTLTLDCWHKIPREREFLLTQLSQRREPPCMKCDVLSFWMTRSYYIILIGWQNTTKSRHSYNK